MGIWDKINKITDKIGETVSGTNQETEAQKSIHDEFTQKLSVGKSYTFCADAIIYGGETFPYKTMREIVLIGMPKSLVNGYAQIHFLDGNIITLYFDFIQQERFLKALDFANEEIKAANGIVAKYIYQLRFACGSKLEVYEDYASLSYIPSGMKNHFSNSLRAGAIETSVEFNEIEISIGGADQNGQIGVSLSAKGENYQFLIPAESKNAALEAAEYMKSKKNTNTWEKPESAQAVFAKHQGEERELPLLGESLGVTKEFDVLNEYRLRFRQLADDCANAARAQFDKKVHNLSTYLDFFPKIYGYYLAMICEKAMEIVVAEGIWTVTRDSLLDFHYENFHLAPDDFAVTLESVELTIEKNQNAVSGVMSYIPNLVGGGFGLKGAAKGIATATAFNVARDSLEAGLLKGVSTINQAQQNELYDRINHDILFEHVFLDYWRMFISLICVLDQNGKEIPLPSDEEYAQALNIFQNLSNPNFPQDQLVHVFLQILSKNPYDVNFHKFMLQRFGKTEETEAISNYFGYTDFNNPRIL